jgi:hypothetical protein
MPQAFGSFEDFWPNYLQQHATRESVYRSIGTSRRLRSLRPASSPGKPNPPHHLNWNLCIADLEHRLAEQETRVAHEGGGHWVRARSLSCAS